MRFIDLFAGLGGFHQALAELGHTCVFASELDDDLRETYQQNFGILPEGDIRSLKISEIPDHDILCAGFPCQPFSKAGDQRGFKHPEWGDLFDYTLRIIKSHKPAYIILENVPNIVQHASGKTWKRIQSALVDAGYDIAYRRLSPHRFGIPQIRERVFIVGSRTGLPLTLWPNEVDSAALSITSVLEAKPEDARGLSPQVVSCLDTWQRFLEVLPPDIEIPSFPIWSMEFGATYPYEQKTPFATKTKELRRYRGSHGKSLSKLSREEIMQALPSYARTEDPKFPSWKIQFIRQNREFYKQNKKTLDSWLPLILKFPPSLQKFEWNCKGVERDLWNLVVQFRASGVRVKRPTTAPSLIAMTTTQVPIIAWERRYMTPRECAKLQSMDRLKHLPKTPTKAYKALGNAVNVQLVQAIAGRLLQQSDHGQRPATQPGAHAGPAVTLQSRNRSISLQDK